MCSGLAWFGFWVSHKQYMAGHDTGIFTHKTEAEKALREKAAKAGGSE